jgi:vacuolar-type H+-ATPase subunit H
MASKTIAEINEAEQTFAQAVSQAQSQAERIVETARQEARQYLQEEAEKTAAAVSTIEAEAKAEIERLEREAGLAAQTRVETLRKQALRKLDAAEELVISMVIPQ